MPIFLSSSRETREELLTALADWRGRYRTARLALAAYLKAVSPHEAPDVGLFEAQAQPELPLFPWGTYQLRLRLGAPCHPPPG